MTQTLLSPDPVSNKPRIAIMGEFSAGKSTLVNLLLGQSVSPVKVTATQLPPVWYAAGSAATYRIDMDGAQHPISADELNRISPKDTQALRVFLESDVLSFCDLIDMPGTSDPNMSPSIWDTMLAEAHGVIWCTAANQAWRQSEAAWWDQLPLALQDNGLLLITRMDTLLTERDQKRVVARVSREVDDMFQSVHPVSLTDALEGMDDPDVLNRCGVTGFADALMRLVEALGDNGDVPISSHDAAPCNTPESSDAPADDIDPPVSSEPAVMPRRIAPSGGMRRPRPAAVAPLS